MKRITSFTLLFILLLSLFLPYSAKAGDDISGHYFENEMRALISKKILTGYGNGSYKPDGSVTRAEFTTFLVRSLKLSTSGTTSGGFKDVKSGSWEYPYVMAASKANLIQGYGDGTFRPDKYVSRQEIAVMIKRAMDSKGVTSKRTALSFTDSNSIGSSFRTAVEHLVSTGIINGNKASNGTVYFAPKAEATRGQSAAMLNRMLDTFATGSYQTSTNPTGEKAVSVDVLNMRKGPGTNYSIAGKLQKGNVVTTYQKTGDWYYVSYGSLKGYVHGAYLKDKTAVATGTKVVNTSVLNVRSGPGTGYSKVGSLQGGNVITTYNYSGSWVYMSSGTLKGYVHTAYLTDKATASTNRVIAIDAGHGDHDPGAIANGVVEKEVNLDVSKRIEAHLKNAGVKVVMTRTNDTFLSLSARVKYAADRGADSFVSIHANAAGVAAARGTETFYYTSATERDVASKQLATFIQRRLVAALGTYDRGVKTGNFQVVKYNTLPSALVELGFVTNSSDAQKLASSTYRDKAARAISAGIIDYYNWKESK